MTRTQRLFITSAFGIVFFSCLPVFAAQNQFTVHVPMRTNPQLVDQYPIMKLKVTVYIDTASPVTFSIQDPWGDSPVSIGPLQPVSPVVPSSLTFFPAPGSRNASSVRIYPPDSSLPASDPNFGKYVLLFDLNSDFQLGAACSGTMTSAEDWTISVTPGPHIARGCAQSLNTSITGNNSCTGSLGPVPRTGDLATIPSLPLSSQGCRPGVDAILVLDKSGSMGDPDLNMPSEIKINALRTAVQTLVTSWDAIRSTESSASGIPQIVSPADQIGVVLFDTDVGWWPTLGTGLKDFSTVEGSIVPNLNTITQGTRTNIGGGLETADTEFGAGHSAKPENRHVVLLMTDGIQNERRGVGVDNSVVGKIVTYPINNPAASTPLPNKTQYQLYVTSVGVSSAVDPTHIFPMGQVDGDNYRNAETDATQLPTFFTEMLQNFLQFSTQETVKIIAGKVTPGTQFKPAKGFPITTTSASAVFSLTWNASVSPNLQLTVFPPGGGTPIVKSGSGGSMVVSVSLPLKPPADPKGDWQVQIEIPTVVIGGPVLTRPDLSPVLKPVALALPNGDGNNAAFQPATATPFQLVVLSDDLGINSKLQIASGNYGPGDPIKLQVKLSDFGDPVTTATVNATIVKPGKSIGDLLSESNADSDPKGPDQDTQANTKLKNTLKANPALLLRDSDAVTLFDDGKPEHGDAKAGDGIYSALYPSQLPGHYNFLFLAEGETPRSGKFSRMQINTVYVSPTPDKSNTQIQTSTTTGTSGNVLTITMTPRTKAGDRMGPGWASYFWFTAAGMTPFKAKDNLNGTYIATVPYPGNTPPQVTIHFLNVPLLITDAVTPDHLPVTLGSGNSFTTIPGGGSPGKFAIFADIGTGVPLGNFSNAFTTGVSFNGGAEYIFNAHLSLEGIFGVHYFPGSVTGNLTVVQFTGGAKAFLNPGPNRLFVRGGVGGYHFNVGSTTDFGGYVGPGFLHEFNSHLGLELGATFHGSRTPGNASWFSTYQVGIRYVLP